MRVLAAMMIYVAAPFAVADEPAANPTKATFEQHFLEMMSHHHGAGIEMANVCQQKAQLADLKQMCGKMAAEQKKESDQMQGWLGSWYQGKGGMPKAEMDKMMAEHKAHMQKLNSAQGAAFDQVFLQLMTKHHEQAIPKAKQCQASASHAELKSLCADMVQSQTRDRSAMQQMLTSRRQGQHAGHSK
jgi:uncharacterized protein (DUF305 family)